MSFITNAFGGSNQYNATSGAGPNSAAQQATDQTNFTNTQGQQGTLASQLLAQANGQGPNIANLQLQQATNQNNQSGAAAIASQRGMNPALAARIIANQTATNNQNAAGQSGVLRAQQQLAAQGAAANVLGQQAGESEANLGRLTQAQTAATSTNANIAGQNAQTNANLTGGILGGLSGGLLAQGGEVESPQKHLQRLLISIGGKVNPMHLAVGGNVPHYDLGTDYASEDSAAMPLSAGIDPSHAQYGGDPSAASVIQAAHSADPMNAAVADQNTAQAANVTKPNAPIAAKKAGSDLSHIGAALPPSPLFGNVPSYNFAAAPVAQSFNPLMRAHGGLVDAMISPGERVIPPHLVEAVRSGKKKASEVAPKIPGKAKVKGDNEKNDTVPAKLAEGSVVIKRTKAENDSDAREFLLALKKQKDEKDGPQGYAKVLAAKRKNA
jgi:hypothetical protein